MKNKIEYFFFLLFSFVFSLLGSGVSRKAAGFLTYLVYYLIPVRKKVVLQNIALAFPEMDEAAVQKIAFECYRSFIITLIEILSMNTLRKDEIKKKVKVENPELIINKYKEGRGVILLSAHFGNWEYSAASVSLQLNIPFYVIVKSQRNPYVTEWMNRVRQKWDNKVVPLGVSIRQIYQQLKQSNIIAMAADQRGPAEGTKMEFFGRRTSVFTGPAALALKTGAPIIYGLAIRQPDYSYRLDLHEISQDNLPDGEEEKITEITRRYISYLEGLIRKYPEQWLWMHNRWKH